MLMNGAAVQQRRRHHGNRDGTEPDRKNGSRVGGRRQQQLEIGPRIEGARHLLHRVRQHQ
jgi:hypothetical protein